MMFKECLTRCHLKIWSLGPPCYWDVCNARRGKRHWNYFNNCSKRMCVTFVRFLNARTNVDIIEEGMCVH
jgi:hypothetical protein